jgi:hypothetical protein
VRASWAIWPYWWVRCRHFYGRSLMEQLLAGEPAPDPEQARAIAIHGAMSLFLGDHGVAVASLAQAIERLRELEDDEALGFSQVAMGLVASVVQPSDTMPRMHEALSCLRRARDPYGVAIALNGLCWMDLQLDLDQEPLDVYEAATDAAQYIGSMVEVAISFANLGRKLATDDPVQAITLLRRAMVLLVETDMPSGISYVVDGLAEVAAAQSDEFQAARLYGFADSLLELAGSMAATAARDRRDRVLAEIRGRIGGDTTDEAMAGGRSLGLREGIDDALSACDRYLEFLRRNSDSMTHVRRADPAPS